MKQQREYLVNDNWGNELNAHSTEYNWRTFYVLYALRWVYIVVIMRKCNAQANEYNLRPLFTQLSSHNIDSKVVIENKTDFLGAI